MDEDITQRQESPGRIFRMLVTGDSADEIEMAALDEARAFFGDGPRLEVVHDYVASAIGPNSSLAASGKKYSAGVKVRTVES